MIASLHGILLETDAQYAVIECAGVGYRCMATRKTLAALPPRGSEAFLHTSLVSKEGAIELYGFADTAEMTCFKQLTAVSGVGPRIAIALLSDFSPNQIALYVASGDAKSLTAASGVGVKLAQRIVLELKDKVGDLGLAPGQDGGAISRAVSGGNTAEAIEALVALGCSLSEASLAVSGLDSSLSVEQLIKDALKHMSKK